MRTFKLKPWVYAGLLALSPMAADAAGLGKLTVTSALGQPLRAEIELLAVQPDELDSLSARIASPEAFQEAKIERGGALLAIKFAIEQRKNGHPVLRLSTTQPVNEPFLDMLIEFNWAAGKLLREYTVLLDPPGYVEPEAVAPVVPPMVRAETPPPAETAPPPPQATPLPPQAEAPGAKQEAAAEAKPAKETKPAAEAKPVKGAKPAKQARTPKPQAPAAEAAPQEAPQEAPPGEAKSYGPVKKGDTLNHIATEYKPEGLSLEQMLVALYQANKKAFDGNNMNRLKTGQILRIPEQQQVAAVAPQEAAREVKTHTADWNAYRQKLAGAVAEAPAPAEQAPKQAATGKIGTAVEEKGAKPAAPSKDVLQVSKGEAAANAKKTQELQGKVQALEEEKTAKGKALTEANERIAALEKNVKDMQQLIELRNKDLAEMQKKAQAKPPEAPPAKPEAAAPVPPPTAPAKVEKPAEAPKPEAAKPEAPKPEAPKPEMAKPVPPPAPVAPPPKPKPAPPPPPPEPGLLENPLVLGGGVGAVLLAGGAALFAINRRRRKSLSSFEDSILTGGDLKANTVFGETAGGVVDTGDTSFLTDFSQAGLGTIDTNDVDPIAEAEVYMAYGRDAQAEEILKEAMTKDPNRHEVHLKLLEIYASRKNLLAFETLAGELYAALAGKPSAVWDKAAEMGRELDPNNPLYATGHVAEASGTAKAAPEIAFTAPSLDLETPTALGTMESEEPPPELTADLDFDVEKTLAPAPEEDISALEFDLGNIAVEAPAKHEPAKHEPAKQEEEALDFDFGEATMEMPAHPAEPIASSPAASGHAGDELDLDLGTLSEPQPEHAEFAEHAETLGHAEIQIPPLATEAVPEDLDFGLELPEIEAAPAAADMHLDFDFDLGEEHPAEAKAPAAIPDIDLSGISLDLGEPAGAPQPAAASALPAEGESAEVATKLDLARAYVEMGDKEGAKEILDEVLKEGNDQQQADAKQILLTI